MKPIVKRITALTLVYALGTGAARATTALQPPTEVRSAGVKVPEGTEPRPISPATPGSTAPMPRRQRSPPCRARWCAPSSMPATVRCWPLPWPGAQALCVQGLGAVHAALVNALVALAGLHALAALAHHALLGDSVLRHMLPSGVPTRPTPRR